MPNQRSIDLYIVSPTDRQREANMLTGEERVAMRNARLLFLLQLGLLVLLATMVAFWNLDMRSVSWGDEATHTRVTQAMWQSGDWWTPRIGKNLYFNKPPFKMWLSLIPLSLFGDTNFSYRFLDALAGVGTAILTFVFAVRLFGSPFAGLISGVALLGVHAYVFSHGIRTAVQDSMLVFLATFALYCGFSLVESAERGASRSVLWRWALLGAVTTGCAVLTKNVAGFVPLAVLALWCLLSGRLKLAWHSLRWQIAVVIVIAVAIPALYVVPHCLYTHGACKTLLGTEVVRRATVGFHNRGNVWFYFIRIFKDKATLPPDILIVSLVYATLALFAFRVEQRFRSSWLLLLIWCCLPIAVYSLIPSRLTWYIAPAFPAMALLGGTVTARFLSSGYRGAMRWWNGAAPGIELRLLVLLVGLFFVGRLIFYYSNNVIRVADTETKIPAERIAAQIQVEKKAAPVSLVVYARPALGRAERLYFGRFWTDAIRTQEAARLDQFLQGGERFLLLTDPVSAYKAMEQRLPVAYRFLRPTTDRRRWLAVLFYADKLESKGLLTPAVRLFDCPQPLNPSETEPDPATDKTTSMFGWLPPVTASGVSTCRSVGPWSAFRVHGDTTLARLGSVFELNAVSTPPHQQHMLDVALSINGRAIETFPVRTGGLNTYRVLVPPNTWAAGDNAVIFTYSKEPTADIASNENLLTMNWWKNSLRAPADAPS